MIYVSSGSVYIMLWQSLYLLSLVAVFASSAVLPVQDVEDASVVSFSLDVARRESSERNFHQEWAAVRQKWGGKSAKSGPSAFSLADDGK